MGAINPGDTAFPLICTALVVEERPVRGFFRVRAH